jgi:hypothetical protein
VEILKAKIRLARLNRSSTAYLEEQLMVAKARLTSGKTYEYKLYNVLLLQLGKVSGQTANKTSSSSEKDVIASSVKEGGSSNKYYGKNYKFWLIHSLYDTRFWKTSRIFFPKCSPKTVYFKDEE